MASKLIAKTQNKKGVWFGLIWEHKEVVAENNHIVTTDEKIYTLYKLCENYDSRVRSGIRKTWRVVKTDMTEKEGKALFKRRIK